ncbi:MAG: hypothetical protein K6E55_08635, partial [Thermoguttaceae bacterium]|nr:hypothetical protein [Thermoguttaceae bacterium]
VTTAEPVGSPEKARRVSISFSGRTALTPDCQIVSAESISRQDTGIISGRVEYQKEAPEKRARHIHIIRVGSPQVKVPPEHDMLSPRFGTSL